jgi:hypothetical protein
MVRRGSYWSSPDHKGEGADRSVLALLRGDSYKFKAVWYDQAFFWHILWVGWIEVRRKVYLFVLIVTKKYVSSLVFFTLVKYFCHYNLLDSHM